MFPLFIIPIAATGIAGAGKTVKSVADSFEANRLTGDANERIELARARVERSRLLCRDMLEGLGQEKVFVLNNSVARFIASFERIKNLEVKDSLGLDELRRLRIDRESVAELKEMQQLASAVVGGVGAGVAGGALTAFGAYNAAMAFGAASTGTAISTLSGAAATNATLAFFGGGSLAAGGMGMAGGMMVLGGLVAAPALLVMGMIVGKKAEERLETARANSAQADEIVAELENVCVQCDAIRRRTALFYTFLARLDARLLPLVFALEDVLEDEGEDFSRYSKEARSVVLRSATMVSSVKAILDTPILTEEGALTPESEALASSLGVRLLAS